MLLHPQDRMMFSSESPNQGEEDTGRMILDEPQTVKRESMFTLWDDLVFCID